MKIGIPKEIMTGEGRVSLTPDACKSLIEAGHRVFVQKGAGINSGYSDEEYRKSAAELVNTAQALYESAQLVIKVKQPLAQDIEFLRSDHILFSYLHLAADLPLVNTLCEKGITAIPFESVVAENGQLPLLAPMSQVAGRIATIRGASLLFRNRGGRGVLLGGIDGADAGRVVILGAGVAGSHALAVAVALGAQVDVLDLDEDIAGTETAVSRDHDAFIQHRSGHSIVPAGGSCDWRGAAGGSAVPVVLPQSVVKQMHAGSVIVDIAIDQGGCVEGIRATSSEQLCYIENGVIHSAVPNMPAAVARTSSQSLSSAILPYVKVLAGSDLADLSATDSALEQVLKRATAIHQGKVVDEVLRAEIA